MQYLYLFLLGCLSFSCAPKAPFSIQNLKTNHIDRPLGLEEKPRFSWQVSGSTPFKQAAYQLKVASSYEKIRSGEADLWDSGRIPSGQSTHLAYEGTPLASSERAYWTVQVWSESGETATSEASWWETGLLEAADWKGQWISHVPPADSVPPVLPAPHFRTSFTLDQPVHSARLYISGIGYHEVYINGEKVGDHVLDPALTRYDKRVNYTVHDVTDMLQPTENALGVVLGNGWYNQHTREAWDFDQAPWRESPSLRCQLLVSDKEGNEQIIASDDSWTFTDGPIVFNSIHNGETYDARKELGDWTLFSYDDADWKPALVVPGPTGTMAAQVMPPIRVVAELDPVSTWSVNDTVQMVDLGQNITGWAKIKVSGPPGSQVTLRYGERIYPDSTLDVKELSRFIWTGDTQTDRYILQGEGIEEWHPVFTYHGFQYIEVRISNPDVEVVQLVGQVVHTDLQERGYFRSSNEMLNKVQENLKWSFLGNYHGYPTDCPHREKMGWTGDALLVAETGQFNFDMTRAYLKWLDDYVDEQQESGDLPGIIPSSGWGYTYGKGENNERGYGPQWEGAFMEIPWQLYRFTGDTSIIRKYYPYMKKYVDYLHVHSDKLLLNFGIDDHKQLENLTDGPFLASAFFHYFTGMLSEMAGIIGLEQDKESYRQLAQAISEAFNARYFDAATHRYAHGGQTPQAVALFAGVVAEEHKAGVLAALLQAIAAKDGHIDAGVVGTKALITVLMEYGHTDVLYAMANKRSFPGWGYWIDELGANTLFQNWDGSQSRNHIMFGSIGDFFYKGLGGIQVAEEAPGFAQVVIRPSFANDLDWVATGHEGPYGWIRSHWKKEAERILLELEVPANSQAELRLPASGEPAEWADGSEVSADRLQVAEDHAGPYRALLLPSGTHRLVIARE
nr:Bacterial alpha-L-rhamnosidase [Cytophagales bacterium]